MKLIQKVVQGRPVYVTVTWGDHYAGCSRCREVDLKSSATLVKACALGGELIKEEMAKIAALLEAKKKREVREWAKKAGVFKL